MTRVAKDGSTPGRKAIEQGVLAGLAVIVLGLAVIRWMNSGRPPTSVVLRQTVEEVPGRTMKLLNVRVPEDGTLAIEISPEARGGLSAYLATREPGITSHKPNEFRLLWQWVGDKSGHCARTAMVARGEYQLVVINSEPGGANVARVRVEARLTPSE